MKKIAILILTVLGCVHANSQSNVIDSAEMKDLMNIIEVQQRLGSAPDTNDRFDGIYVRKGQNRYGEILFHVDGKWIRKGQNPYGQILYTVDGNWIRKEQNSYGQILFTIQK